MTQEASLKKRYLLKLIANIINGLVNIVIVAVVPSALGSISYGVFTYLQRFFTQFAGFMDAGTSIAFFTKLSAQPSRKELLSFYSLYSIGVLLFMGISIYLINFFGFEETILPGIPHEFVYHGLFFGFLFWLSQNFIRVSDAYALTVSIEIAKIVQKLSALALLGVIIKFVGLDLKSYYYFQYLTLLIFFILALAVFAKKKICSIGELFKRFSFLKISKEFFSYVSPLFVYNLVSLVACTIDLWVLQKVNGSSETGFYGLAFQIAAMCFLFTSAMTPVITREFSKHFEENRIDEIQRLYYRYIPMLYAIAAYFGVFISIQAKNLIFIFADANFLPAFYPLIIMGFYPIHQTYGQLSGAIFYSTGKTRKYRDIGVITMLIGLLLTYIFMVHFKLGASGLALKMVLTQLLSVNIMLYYNCRDLDLKHRFFLKHQVGAVIFFLLMGILSARDFHLSPTLNFIASGMLYSFLVMVIAGRFFPSVFSLSKDEIVIYTQKIFAFLKKRFRINE